MSYEILKWGVQWVLRSFRGKQVISHTTKWSHWIRDFIQVYKQYLIYSDFINSEVCPFVFLFLKSKNLGAFIQSFRGLIGFNVRIKHTPIHICTHTFIKRWQSQYDVPIQTLEHYTIRSLPFSNVQPTIEAKLQALYLFTPLSRNSYREAEDDRA